MTFSQCVVSIKCSRYFIDCINKENTNADTLRFIINTDDLMFEIGGEPNVIFFIFQGTLNTRLVMYRDATFLGNWNPHHVLSRYGGELA